MSSACCDASEETWYESDIAIAMGSDLDAIATLYDYEQAIMINLIVQEAVCAESRLRACNIAIYASLDARSARACERIVRKRYDSRMQMSAKDRTCARWICAAVIPRLRASVTCKFLFWYTISL